MVFIIQYSSSYYLNLFNPFIIYLHIIKRIAIMTNHPFYLET